MSVQILKTKAETYEIIKNFIKQVEVQHNKYVKSFRTDNRSEFFFQKNGKTVPKLWNTAHKDIPIYTGTKSSGRTYEQDIG